MKGSERMEKKKKSILGKIDSLFPNCRDVTMLVVKEQEIPLTFRQKYCLYFHLMVCKFCRAFRVQSGILHQHVHHLSKEAANAETGQSMSAERKAEIEKLLSEQHR